jgi:hypothetical protein
MAMQFFTAEPDQWEAKVQQLASDLQAKYPQTVTKAPPAPRLYGEGVPEDGLITLKTDHYTVPFSANQAWTIYEISFDDKLISHHNGFHGTVMIPKGSDFVGTGHTQGGREIVHSVTVKVDDKDATPITAEMMGTTLSGHKITVLKHSTIAKFDCTAEVTVTDDHVYERTTLDPKEPIELTCLYYFMHCFQPTTTKWAAELPDGTFEQGDLDGTGGFRVNKDTVAVAQYDPTTNLGYLCYTPKVISGPGSCSMIWNLDKTRYHKYYLRYTTKKAFQPGDKLLEADSGSPYLYARAFATSVGAHRVLLVNKRNRPLHVAFDTPQSLAVQIVDQQTAFGPPRSVQTAGARLELPPLAVAVVTLP